jgi:glycosyltransferase involved in cell wall biosynthesis
MTAIDTVHLVYAHGPKASAPDAIGRNLGDLLSTKYRVVFHDWDAFERIPSSPTSALVGHAHPLPGTTFRRSLRGNWGRVILLQPFSTSTSVNGYLLGTLDRVDHFLAIMGRYWADQIPSSAFAGWADRIEQVDLAIDPSDFQRIRHDAAPPGARRFLYVGSGDTCKNLPYLDAIAGALPDFKFSWAGSGTSRTKHLARLGFVDFRTAAGRRVVKDHDFMITVGSEDANPTTILEAMAWGLIPIATPQSGYYATAGLINVPLGDVARSVEVLRELQRAPEEELTAMKEANWIALEAHFNWDRFGAQVEHALAASTSSRRVPSVRARLEAVWWAAFTPYMPYRRRGAAMVLRRLRAR